MLTHTHTQTHKHTHTHPRTRAERDSAPCMVVHEQHSFSFLHATVSCFINRLKAITCPMCFGPHFANCCRIVRLLGVHSKLQTCSYVSVDTFGSLGRWVAQNMCASMGSVLTYTTAIAKLFAASRLQRTQFFFWKTDRRPETVKTQASIQHPQTLIHEAPEPSILTSESKTSTPDASEKGFVTSDRPGRRMMATAAGSATTALEVETGFMG